MIHSKYYNILKQFLGDYKKEIYGRGLYNKILMSQKATALALDELEKQKILKSKKQGNMKFFRLNHLNPEIKDILVCVEIERKMNFFKRYRKIANLFNQDNRIVGIFGSYAKKTQKKESDIDVFIIGKTQKKDYDAKGEILDLDISIKYFSENDFKKMIKNKNNLCKEIINNHIIIFNAENFVNILWGDYYGFY